MINKIQHIDPQQVTNPVELQKLLVVCMNIIEDQASTIAKQAKQIQELEDEINRMKGEHGRLETKPARAVSKSTKKRTKRKNHKKGGKKANLIIDKIIKCSIDKSILPADARLHRYQNVIQQDLLIKRNNTLFRVPIYYSASQCKTYRGKLPSEYEGQFGGQLKSWIQLLHHYCDVTQGRLKALLDNIGISISKGTITHVLLSNSDKMKQESEDILRSGIEHLAYAHMDATKSKQAGQAKTTQVICSPHYSVYQTMASKSRAYVIGALQGRIANDIPLLYNARAIELLQASKVPRKDQVLLHKLLSVDQHYTLEDFEQLLQVKAAHLLAKESHFKVLAILALAHYQTQDSFPKVRTLLTDAGHEYTNITEHQALCWIHEERHYKVMTPRLILHRKALQQVRAQIWDFYQKLLNFKELPADQQLENKQSLDQQFDQIFTQKTNYTNLDNRIQRTFSKKEKLLRVLHFPDLPLHNNPAELAVRRKVRKRDISLHTMSDQGTKAQDAFMSVVETAAKLGVNALDYLYDRVTNKYLMPSLAQLIKLKAN